MTTVAWKKGLVYLLGCLFSGSVFAAPSLNVSDPDNGALIAAAACVIGEGRWGGGLAIDAERWSDINGDLLLVGAGAELIVFDISTPTAPVELGRVLVNHSATSVAVSTDGSIAAVSDWFDNVTLIDISDRNAPVAQGNYAWPGIQQPTGMAFDGDYLYVAVRTIGLAVLDISDPATPTFVANSDGSPSNFVFDVALRGNYAYLGQSAEGVQVVDISDPSIPSVVGNHAASTGAGQITIDGSRAYVTRGGTGFDILDLTNPIAPALAGTFDTVGFAYEAAVLPGERLAVADNIDGTVIYDISTPTTPVVLGDYGFSPYRLVALDDRVFIVPGIDQTSRIRLVDFQTPASPTEIGHIDFDGRSRAVSVGVNHILVANNERGVVMLDSTNPVAPSVVGRVDIGFDARKIGHVNGYGVASTSYDKNIAVIDPQPGGPTLVTTINNVFQTNDLVDDGTRLYVASGSSGGLRIYDMSNPPTPLFLGSVVPVGETVWQVAVSGNYAYSGYVNDTDLLVIDVSNPAAPATVGSPYVLPGGAIDIAVSGTTVFVGTQLHGVRILQNDGVGNLSEIADIAVSPAVPTGVSVDGDLLYISAGVFSGLLVYDVSDPTDPQFVEQHNTSGDAEDVDADGGVIAMAEGGSGVSSFGCDLAASNQPPVTVGVIGNQNSNEGTTIFPLSTNPNFNDPDGQALAFTATGLPPGLSISIGSGVVEGNLSFDSSGIYPVEITATDPFDLFATQSFTWTIIEINAPPVVLSEIVDQVNDEGDNVNLDIHTHFSDPDGDTLRFEAGDLPIGLSIDETSGIISGVLTSNSSGSYTTLVLAFDPDDEVTGQTFGWVVANINTPPVTLSDIADQVNDEGDNINLDIHSHFSDPDGDTLRFEAGDLPIGLSIDETSGIISGMLTGNSSGNYSTQVFAYDQDDAVISQTFSWTVADINATPVVLSEIADQINDEGDNVNLDIHTHFSDPDGDALRFEAGDLPIGLSIDETSGIISGMLTGNSSGNYSTQVFAYDPDDAVISQIFSWTVADTITDPLLFKDSFE